MHKKRLAQHSNATERENVKQNILKRKKQRKNENEKDKLPSNVRVRFGEFDAHCPHIRFADTQTALLREGVGGWRERKHRAEPWSASNREALKDLCRSALLRQFIYMLLLYQFEAREIFFGGGIKTK